MHCIFYIVMVQFQKQAGGESMFLFKNAKNKVKRTGMNMAALGFAGVFILMVLAPLIPKTMGKFLYAIVVILSIMAIIGSLISVICFIIELFATSFYTVQKDPFSTEAAVLLFETRSQHTDKNDFIHYSNKQFYLKSNRTVFVKTEGGMYDGHSSRGMGPMVKHEFISFKKLNEYIEQSQNQSVQKYKGISKNNCMRIVAENLYEPDKIQYIPDSAEELYYKQQKAMLAAEEAFIPKHAHIDNLCEYALPFDEFERNSEILFVLRGSYNTKSHYIAKYNLDGRLYEVHSHCIGSSGISYASCPVNIFDIEEKCPIRMISNQEMLQLLIDTKYEIQLFFERSDYSADGIYLVLDKDKNFVIRQEYTSYGGGGSIEDKFVKDVVFNQSIDSFLESLNKKFKKDFSHLKEKSYFMVLMDALKE